jgi:hypothetical protein
MPRVPSQGVLVSVRQSYPAFPRIPSSNQFRRLLAAYPVVSASVVEPFIGSHHRHAVNNLPELASELTVQASLAFRPDFPNKRFDFLLAAPAWS